MSKRKVPSKNVILRRLSLTFGDNNNIAVLIMRRHEYDTYWRIELDS